MLAQGIDVVYVFLLFPVLQTDERTSHRGGGDDHGENYAEDAVFLGLCQPKDTLLHGRTSQPHRITVLLRNRIQQNAGVFQSVFPIQLGRDGVITGQLRIPLGQNHSRPHQGIPPMGDQGEDTNYRPHVIAVAQVHVLVKNDERPKVLIHLHGRDVDRGDHAGQAWRAFVLGEIDLRFAQGLIQRPVGDEPTMIYDSCNGKPKGQDGRSRNPYRNGHPHPIDGGRRHRRIVGDHRIIRHIRRGIHIRHYRIFRHRGNGGHGWIGRNRRRGGDDHGRSIRHARRIGHRRRDRIRIDARIRRALLSVLALVDHHLPGGQIHLHAEKRERQAEPKNHHQPQCIHHRGGDGSAEESAHQQDNKDQKR